MLNSLFHGVRTRAAMQAEIIALPHQLRVLQRIQHKSRLKLSDADRWLWVWLSRVWTGWRSALSRLTYQPVGRNGLAAQQLRGHTDAQSANAQRLISSSARGAVASGQIAVQLPVWKIQDECCPTTPAADRPRTDALAAFGTYVLAN
jgi:hypothetical protein